MAQEWSTRYPLVDGHGNFGSVDGDNAAAMRYTEARLSKISMEMLADINKNTVDFMPNFDETEKEPVVLPSRYPNLLVNGTQGIAVGMATNIPPHNLRGGHPGSGEDHRQPGGRGQRYRNRGSFWPSSKALIFPPVPPFSVRKALRKHTEPAGARSVPARFQYRDHAQRQEPHHRDGDPVHGQQGETHREDRGAGKDKKIDGITDLRDESDRSGMRICIELRKDVNANVVLNQLYKHTQLQETFGVIMLALVNNEPKVLSLKELLEYYLKHQEDVVTRRTKYDLNKAEERAHILKRPAHCAGQYRRGHQDHQRLSVPPRWQRKVDGALRSG